MSLLEAGRTRIHTRREQQRVGVALCVTLIGTTFAFWASLIVVSFIQGEPLPEVHGQWITAGGGILNGGTLRPPVYLVYSDNISWIAVGTITGIALLALFIDMSRWLNRRPDPRERHLATPKEIRRMYSPKAVRREGAYTLPDSTWKTRRLLPTHAFGIRLGAVRSPRKAGDAWLSPEHRLRIIARPGWGKTFRLLVPMIRDWTGPAVVSSVEPDIFLSTVRARQFRWPGGRRRILPTRERTFDGTRWVRPQREEYPVYVVECMPPGNRVATNYPSVRWDPIPGCERYSTARRRAKALVKGLDDGNDNQEGGTNRWFESVCADVIAAWLHALAFTPTGTLDDMNRWLRTKNLGAPTAILDQARGANPKAAAALLTHEDAITPPNPSAATNIGTHLSKEGGRTTANVYTFLARAIASLTGEEGRQVIAVRGEPGQFDPAQLIRDEGTLFLLAEEEQMDTVRPLLSLIAGEVARAGQQVARARGGDTDPDREIGVDEDVVAKRLPRALCLFLDELRRGVRIADLPAIAQRDRKFGITYVYAATNGGDEKALYGQADADALESAAVSLIGGYDKASAPEVERVAGQRPVVVTTWTSDGRSEHEEMRPVLDASDLQRLPFGDAVVVAPAMSPFIIRVKDIRRSRRMRRRLRVEKQEARSAA